MDLEQKVIGGPAIADLIAYGYRNNQTVAAQRQTWRMEIERYRLESGYPDPQVMVTYFTDPIETRLGPQDWNATLTQQIPFPGKLTKKGAIVATDAKIARLGLDKAVRDMIVSIRESYHELLYIQAAKKIAARNNELLEQFRKISETSYAEDHATLADVVKAQAQVGQLRYDILLLEELEQTEKTKLNTLLNRDPHAVIGRLSGTTISPVVYNLEEIYQLAQKNSEEIQSADLQYRKSKIKKKLAGYGFLPDFKVGVFYAEIGDPDVLSPPKDAGRDAVGVQAGMTIPLWFGKNKSGLDRAGAGTEKALALKNETINRTNAGIREMFFRLRNAQRLVSLYEQELLPQAVRSLESMETWQREGQGSFADLLEIQATVYNFQLSLARAQADYGKFLARLERLCGRGLTSIEPTGNQAEGTVP